MNDRRALLTAALGCLHLPPRTPTLRALHSWLDSWSGLGLVVVGMERHGYALSLHKMHDDGWRASFYADPQTHSAAFICSSTARVTALALMSTSMDVSI